MARSSPRSATTTSSTPTAAAACAWSTSRARPGRCPPARNGSARAWSSRPTARTGALRKTLTEMLLAEHLAPNPGGRPNELTDLAEELGAQAPFVLPDAGREAYDDRNRLMGYEPDACILCNRCVRYTQEVMQCSALTFEGRGAEARVVPTHGHSWLDTECELCGGCLSVCPTGAIHEQFLAGAPAGHERALVKTKTTCTFCGVGCQIDLNVDPETQRIVKVTSEPSYVSNEGNLCVKGRFAFNFVHHPDRLTQAARPRRGREAARDRLGHGPRGRSRRPFSRPRAPRPAVDRRPRLGTADERGELPAAEVRAGGDRHQLDPLLRSHLTRADSLRPGQVVGQRSKHQLDPRDREHPVPVRDRLEHDGGPPGAGAADEEGGPQRRHARRRRPAQDLADEDREATPAASAGHRRLADQRDAARDLLRGPPGRRLHRGAHGGRRRRARDRLPLHARGGRRGHGRSGRGHPGHGPRVRGRAARRDLLHARHHRARLRGRQHLVALEPGARDRPPRLRVHRPERAARPEQRPGAERLRRQSRVFPRLPVGRRPGDPREVRGRVGRRPARDARLPARPDHLRPPRRPHEGALPRRREPGAHRAEREARRGGVRARRVRRRAGPVPERADGEVRRRRLPGLELRREGRDVHEHRAAGQPRAAGRAPARARRASTATSSSRWPGRWARPGPSTPTRSRCGTSSPT